MIESVRPKTLWIIREWATAGVYQVDANLVDADDGIYQHVELKHIYYRKRGVDYAFTAKEARDAVALMYADRADELMQSLRILQDRLDAAHDKLRGPIRDEHEDESRLRKIERLQMVEEVKARPRQLSEMGQKFKAKLQELEAKKAEMSEYPDVDEAMEVYKDQPTDEKSRGVLNEILNKKLSIPYLVQVPGEPDE